MLKRLTMGLLGLVTLFGLTACGFKLQGSYRWPEQWPGYRVHYEMRQPGMAEFAELLNQGLQYRGLKPELTPAFVLKLTQLEDSRVVAAIGGDGKVVEYDLGRTIHYQILADGWSSAVYSQSTSRRLSFDPNQALAKELEEARLRQGLSRELIELMLLRVEIELREAAELSAKPEGEQTAE